MNEFYQYIKSPSKMLLGGLPRWLLFLVPPIGFFGPFKLTPQGIFQVVLFESYLIIGWTVCFFAAKLNIDSRDIKGKRLYITDYLLILVVGSLAAFLGMLIFDNINF